MSDELRTTGTTPQDDGDAQGTATTGTPDGADRDADGLGGISKELALSWKSSAEQLNAERKRREELEARLAEVEARQQSPAAGRDTPDDYDDLSPYLQGAQQFASQKDPVAGLGVAIARRIEKLEKERDVERRIQADREQLREISTDRDYQKKVAEYYIQNQHRLGDPLAAHNEIQAKELARERDELRQKLASFERKPSDVVRTEVREVPGSDTRTRKMSLSEFNQAVAEAPMFEALRMKRMYREGKIELTD